MEFGSNTAGIAMPGVEEKATGNALRPDIVIWHKRADDVVPFGENEELANISRVKLIVIGIDDRPAALKPLAAKLSEFRGEQ